MCRTHIAFFERKDEKCILQTFQKTKKKPLQSFITKSSLEKRVNQCHLVSDKVGNFHGNKALVTFL